MSTKKGIEEVKKEIIALENKEGAHPIQYVEKLRKYLEEVKASDNFSAEAKKYAAYKLVLGFRGINSDKSQKD